MAELQEPNIGLGYGFDLGEDGWKNSNDRTMIVAGALAQGFAIDDALAAEPGSPPIGATYILPSAAKTGTNWGSDSGAVTDAVAIFTNVAGQVDSSPWFYITPKEGWLIFERTANKWVEFTGSNWVNAVHGLVNKQTGSTYEPVISDGESSILIDNGSHTLNIPDNATVPYKLNTHLTIVNQNAAAITVTDDVAVTYATGSQNLVAAGIAANAVAEIVKTAADEWFVLRNEALPT